MNTTQPIMPAKPRAASNLSSTFAGFGFVSWPNTPVAAASTISGFRKPPVRGPMFRPPRQTAQHATQPLSHVNPTCTSSFQARTSPPIGPVTHDFHVGPMTFIPTLSMQQKPNGRNNAK